MERQITFAPHGHILTNAAVWSPDSRRLVYDVRSDPAGSVFDGDRIETVDVESGEGRVVFQSQRGANCGVATFHPFKNRIVFILGPEPTLDYTYGPARRQGVMLDLDSGEILNLDARDLTSPFTPGALRGGTHLHQFSPDGKRVSFTYEDHVLETGPGERNQRNIGVSVLGQHVRVPLTHSRNHHGVAFSVLVTETHDDPTPGSDEISRAFDEAWIDSRTLACFGETDSGVELFRVELPDEFSSGGSEHLQGTATTRPRPPIGVQQRRLTFDSRRAQIVRHWPRAHYGIIAFLQRDDDGIVQLFKHEGGFPWQMTVHPADISSAFTWTPDGLGIVYVLGDAVWLTNPTTLVSHPITKPSPQAPPRPEACVVSPDGKLVAFVRNVQGWNQIFVAELTSP